VHFRHKTSNQKNNKAGQSLVQHPIANQMARQLAAIISKLALSANSVIPKGNLPIGSVGLKALQFITKKLINRHKTFRFFWRRNLCDVEWWKDLKQSIATPRIIPVGVKKTKKFQPGSS